MMKSLESEVNPNERAPVAKVQSLLEINKTLARENTFLSQQFDVLSKECVSLVCDVMNVVPLVPSLCS